MSSSPPARPRDVVRWVTSWYRIQMRYEVTKLRPHVSGVSGVPPNEVQVFGEVNEALMDDYAICRLLRNTLRVWGVWLPNFFLDMFSHTPMLEVRTPIANAIWGKNRTIQHHSTKCPVYISLPSPNFMWIDASGGAFPSTPIDFPVLRHLDQWHPKRHTCLPGSGDKNERSRNATAGCQDFSLPKRPKKIAGRSKRDQNRYNTHDWNLQPPAQQPQRRLMFFSASERPNVSTWDGTFHEPETRQSRNDVREAKLLDLDETMTS